MLLFPVVGISSHMRRRSVLLVAIVGLAAAAWRLGWIDDYLRLVRSENYLAHGGQSLAMYVQKRAAGDPTAAVQLSIAKQEFAIAARNQPKERYLHCRVGLAYSSHGLTDEAIPWLERAIELGEKDPFVLNNLGYFYAERSVQLDRAVSLIQEALKERPNEAAIVDSLGWAYYRQGRLQEALRLLERAYRLAPDPQVLQHVLIVRQAIRESEP
jgi:tetratricopeptide (TPR) repeat protein